ncbi:hypothetical protein PR202_gb15334 [Eleusine coracana subsp. coracana]|uniref:Uncharacterized protein n=1 Tax=Eleusine coracana subsp. coracana TaxID=191504 RepID=A0AAV5EXC6_ELECO|nr:hypothetical protein PR202_gb15334 [Eleusine coracana subsp. coracana]
MYSFCHHGIQFFSSSGFSMVISNVPGFAGTGVSSMGVIGDGKDRLEVVGDGIDTVCLVKCLRKKVGHADILQVEEVKDKKPEEKKPEEPKVVQQLPYYYHPGYYHYHLPSSWW